MGLRHLALALAGFVAAALGAALTTGPAAAQLPIKVTVEGSFTGPSAPFLVAQDKGYFRAEDIDVAIDAVAVPPDAITRVSSGAAEFGIADVNTLIRFRDQNPTAPVKAIFMIYNEPPYAMVGRKSRGIARPKDIEGKRLGAPATDPATTYWPLFAKLNNIDISKVKVENVAAAVREPMLAAGQVDAVTASSFSAYLNLKERGVPVDDLVILPMAEYGLQLYGDAIIVNSKFASENPDTVKKFLRAYLKGLKETIRDPSRAVESVIKRNESAKKELELERLRMAIRDNILTEEVRANGVGTIDASRFVQAIDQLGQIYKFKTKPEPANIFDMSFLPPAAERKLDGPQRPG